MSRIWWLPGAALIFLGVLIIIYPQLLAYIVAAVFISIGVGMIIAGRFFRRAVSSSITSYRVYTPDQTPPDTIRYD
ncbi:MAG: hypothetical protein AAF787_09810 [Chloroflexota bacterium]